ncbi:MAG: hypothetical protein HYR97_07010 [Candidatus Melainabacteria bacterium]|nr:hypothetical protein [Candidatus Melainabacteria bacterium]
MAAGSISTRKVQGVIYFRGYHHIGVDDFKRAVKEVVDKRKIEPYLFQFGCFPRIPEQGFYRYELQNQNSKSLLEGKDKDDKGLKKTVQKCFEGEYKDSENFVYLVDGEGFDSGTISSLPEYDRLFVMFAPYNALRTVPISEARLYLKKRGQGSKNNNPRFAQVSS